MAVVQAYKRSPGGVFADAYLARYLTDDDPKLAELDDDWLFWFASDPKLWSW
ncbi:MAG: hypothetical protein ACREPI_08985 [Candidatus Dormibacterales bacterium]